MANDGRRLNYAYSIRKLWDGFVKIMCREAFKVKEKGKVVGMEDFCEPRKTNRRAKSY
jgi:hypothetical protein